MTDDEADQVVVYRLPRWATWLIVAMFCISMGASSIALVTVLNSRGEHRRTCAAVQRGIDVTIDGIFNVPQRSDLPKRTPEDEARRKANFHAFHSVVDDALEKC